LHPPPVPRAAHDRAVGVMPALLIRMSRYTAAVSAVISSAWGINAHPPCLPIVSVRQGDRSGLQLVAVFPGRAVCLEAAAKLDFQPLPPHRLESSFLECQNGWKPPWASASHAIGSRVV
jgi:hypothetical protein